MYGKINKIHFVGIGGIGMSGIAEVLNNMGYEITGSDISNSKIIERLRKQGVKINIGHKKSNVKERDVVVISSAIKKDNVEVLQAHKEKIPVIQRAVMLAELMRLKYGIAVVGSHGKTTTTSMVSTVLSHGGFDPTIVVGGRIQTLDSNARLGKGKFMVVEADESDGSFQKLSPVITVLTNIDEEHLDHYKSIENLEYSFLEFLNKIPFYGLAVACIESTRVNSIIKNFIKPLLTYGFSKEANLYAENILIKGFSTVFTVKFNGKKLGKIELKVPGRHNALNALASIGIGLELGMKFKDIQQGLREFKGIERRLQLKGDERGIKVIDDYGHHPQEIKATIDSLKEAFSVQPGVIFQPHRFSRTKLLFKDFVEVLSEIKKLYVLDIYPAGERPINKINSKLLVQEINKKSNTKAQYVNDPEELIPIITKKLKYGQIVLTTGAGNVWKYGEKLVEELQ